MQKRLVENPECRTSSGAATNTRCIPDNDAFRRLINQYGAAIAPTGMSPAKTTGYGGFEILAEGAFTSMASDADYMKKGTRGGVGASSGQATLVNEQPANFLQLYSLRVRKGFGFGIETSLQFGFLPKTSMIAGGADLKIALLEGFRDGVPGFLPDLAAAGGVRTVTGSPQLQLTVADARGVASKPITIAQSGTLTPWIGYQ